MTKISAQTLVPQTSHNCCAFPGSLGSCSHFLTQACHPRPRVSGSSGLAYHSAGTSSFLSASYQSTCRIWPLSPGTYRKGITTWRTHTRANTVSRPRPLSRVHWRIASAGHKMDFGIFYALHAFQYSCLEKPRGQRSLAGYNVWGRKESDMTERLSMCARACTHTHTHTRAHSPLLRAS